MRFCPVLSTIGRSSENDRRSPPTENERAGNVTLRPPPGLRSHTEKPISFKPSSGPWVKYSSASASFPGGLAFSFNTILMFIGRASGAMEGKRRSGSGAGGRTSQLVQKEDVRRGSRAKAGPAAASGGNQRRHSIVEDQHLRHRQCLGVRDR